MGAKKKLYFGGGKTLPFPVRTCDFEGLEPLFRTVRVSVIKDVWRRASAVTCKLIQFVIMETEGTVCELAFMLSAPQRTWESEDVYHGITVNYCEDNIIFKQ